MKAGMIALHAIILREALRFLHQRGRFISALVRPLVWLLVFAAGFRSVLGLSIIPPYETYITYEAYIVPGLCGMVQLFNGMQSSLSLVYDREMGSMRLLLTSPLPRWWLLMCKLMGSTVVSICSNGHFHAFGRVFSRTSNYGCFWNDVGGIGAGVIVHHQAVGKFCWRYELRYFSGLLFVLCALPSLETGRKFETTVLHCIHKPIYTGRGSDPVRALRATQPGCLRVVHLQLLPLHWDCAYRI